MPTNHPMLITLPLDWQHALERIAARRGVASKSAAIRELIAEALPAKERKQLSTPGKRGVRTEKE